MTQTPTVGRIVHYTLDDGSTIPAIITAVIPDSAAVNLTVFIPDRLPGYVDVPVRRAPEPTPGCWNWPPRT